MDQTYNPNGGYKPTVKRFADLDGPDFYPTPEWATYALIESERFEGEIWEPACGDGAMSNVLALTGNSVVSTDLYDRGFGKSGVDFLKTRHQAVNIVTNPPYNSAEQFVEVGVKAAKKKFALLLRLAFLEGARRANTIFAEAPPSTVWVFSERITFYPAGHVAKGSGTTAYAWFVWDLEKPGNTQLKWLKPGFKSSFGKAA